MSQECNCENVNSVRVPVTGLTLDLDLGELSGCDCGPGGGGGDGGLSYSLEEKWTGGYWIDGKKIYQKTVDIGFLPKGWADIPHGINNLLRVLDCKGSAFAASANGMNNVSLPIPFPYPHSTGGIGIYFSETVIRIEPKTDVSNYTCEITLFYTCTDR